MSRWQPPVLVALIVVAALPGTGRVAHAQDVHRCIAADGRSIYTDQDCTDIDAIERKPPPMPSGVQIHVRDCARSPDDLLFGVRSALDAQDVNKLAAFYHWTGVGSAESVRLMNQLDALSQRPLVDVALEGFDAPPDAWDSPERVGAPRSAPNRLHIEQMRSNNNAGSISTTFYLQRNLGCWWIRY